MARRRPSQLAVPREKQPQKGKTTEENRGDSNGNVSGSDVTGRAGQAWEISRQQSLAAGAVVSLSEPPGIGVGPRVADRTRIFLSRFFPKWTCRISLATLRELAR
jgi:hypothetical protein